jgi:hypothetical protein
MMNEQYKMVSFTLRLLFRLLPSGLRDCKFAGGLGYSEGKLLWEDIDFSEEHIRIIRFEILIWKQRQQQ